MKKNQMQILGPKVVSKVRNYWMVSIEDWIQFFKRIGKMVLKTD